VVFITLQLVVFKHLADGGHHLADGGHHLLADGTRKDIQTLICQKWFKQFLGLQTE